MSPALPQFHCAGCGNSLSDDETTWHVANGNKFYCSAACAPKPKPVGGKSPQTPDNPVTRRGIRCSHRDGDCLGCLNKARPNLCGKWDGNPSWYCNSTQSNLDSMWIDLEAEGRPRLLPMPPLESLLGGSKTPWLPLEVVQ